MHRRQGQDIAIVDAARRILCVVAGRRPELSVSAWALAAVVIGLLALEHSS
jgi:hypothetical protein